MNNIELIKDLYYDPKQGLHSVEKLYDKLKIKNITRKEISEFIKKNNQYTNNIKTFKKIKHYQPIKSNYKNHIMQTDLIDMSDILTTNKNIKYILTVIDIFFTLCICRTIKR